ncbi:MAG: SDR family oxidoreductase [Rhodospirillaceae bacterium]|nr:SDR family oxidoreductase [Rhodospirillaceae bacterium]
MTGTDLEKQHALITGGGTGIGLTIARELAARGVRLTLVGRTLARLQQAAKALPRAQAVAADVTDATSIAAALATATQSHGPVSILVNNAGAAQAVPFLETSLAVWNDTINVNLTGAFLCAQAVLPGMRAAKWGRIINIASVAGVTGYAGVAAYVAAKHGLVGLTRSLALEFAKDGITVNALCPGYTETDMAAAAIANVRAKKGVSEEEARAMLAAKNPQKRLIAPEEVAAAAAWLCGPGSQSINGQSIVIAGGEVMP